MSDFDRQKWNRKFTEEQWPEEPSAVLVSLSNYLPTSGKALDIAGGPGRHAIWLAKRGLDVTIADISKVGLSMARERAAAAGVKLSTIETDLQEDRFPAGPWDLITSICFLWRPIFERAAENLAPGGTLVVVQPTKRNLERHDKPPPDFLLDEGELPRLVSGLTIVHYEECWSADGRFDAQLVARKPV